MPALYLYSRFSHILALAWFVGAVALSISLASVIGVLMHRLDTAVGIGSAVMGVLAALQALLIYFGRTSA